MSKNAFRPLLDEFNKARGIFWDAAQKIDNKHGDALPKDKLLEVAQDVFVLKDRLKAAGFEAERGWYNLNFECQEVQDYLGTGIRIGFQ